MVVDQDFSQSNQADDPKNFIPSETKYVILRVKKNTDDDELQKVST